MERIFANLFRVSAPKGKRLSHTYFLKRKKGNILISHKAVPTPEDLAEIEDMGGIESQWVCHTHDLLRGSSHKKLHAQFGCTLRYHEIERSHVEKKLKCPTEHHENEGLRYGSDFEVFYWPTCTSGHCIFRWRSRGKYYLFTSHSISVRDDEWYIDTNKWHLEDLRPQLARLRKLRVDYIFPGYSLAREIGFYRLNDQTRKAFAKALKAVEVDHPLPGHTSPSDDDFRTFTDRSLRANHQARGESLTPAEKNIYVRLRLGERVEKEELDPGPSRLFTNFDPPHLNTLIEELELFAIHQMPGGASGKIDILLNSLELADVFFFFYFRREFGPKHKFWELLRQHVKEGGTLFITDARRKVNPRWISGGHPFPEIAVWGDPTEDPGNELTICEDHPATGDAPGEARFESSFYDSGSLEPGDRGSVLVRNASGRPVAVAGEVGKGRVVFGCFFFHPLRDPARGTKRQLLQGIFRWLVN